LDFVTEHSAKAMNLGERYGLEVGRPANMVLLSAASDYEVLRTQGHALVSIRHGKVIMRRTESEVAWAQEDA
jgi:cytosine deaminase